MVNFPLVIKRIQLSIIPGLADIRIIPKVCKFRVLEKIHTLYTIRHCRLVLTAEIVPVLCCILQQFRNSALVNQFFDFEILQVNTG